MQKLQVRLWSALKVMKAKVTIKCGRFVTEDEKRRILESCHAGIEDGDVHSGDGDGAHNDESDGDVHCDDGDGLAMMNQMVIFTLVMVMVFAMMNQMVMFTLMMVMGLQ
eukprot:Em0004g759a